MESIKLPLPIYTSSHIGEMTGKTGEVFDLVMGLSEKIVAELKERSLDTSDTDLQENTSDYKRFGEGSYEKWYAKQRVPFALVNKESGALAALIWLGPEPLGTKSAKYADTAKKEVPSGNWHTIAFRAYNPYRGQGLMKGFARSAMEVYKHYFPAARIWAGINAKNPASIALAEKLGFHKEESVSDAEWVAMVSD